MYINRPSISGKKTQQPFSQKSSNQNRVKVKQSILENSPPLSRKSYQQKSGTDDWNKDQIQLIQEIFKKWDKAFKSITTDIQNAQKATNQILQGCSENSNLKSVSRVSNRNRSKMQLSDHELQSFQRCKYLLEQQYQSQKMAHYSIIQEMCKQYGVKNLEIQKTKTLIKISGEEIQKYSKEVGFSQQKLKEYKKKIAANTNLQEKIKAERQKVQSLSQKLFQYKEKSMEQKQNYSELQRKEFSLTQEIQFQEEQQQHYSMMLRNKERERKLQKLKAKIENQMQKQKKQSQELLQKKIAKAALLRTNLQIINEVLQQCQGKTEEQEFIILALKNKAQCQENQIQQANLYSQFKNRYDKIYLQTESPQNKKWTEYKQYLHYLLKKNQGTEQKYYKDWKHQNDKNSAEMSPMSRNNIYNQNAGKNAKNSKTSMIKISDKDDESHESRLDFIQRNSSPQVISQGSYSSKRRKKTAYLSDQYAQSQDQKSNQSFSALKTRQNKEKLKTEPKQDTSQKLFKIKKIEHKNKSRPISFSQHQIEKEKQIKKQLINIQKLPKIQKQENSKKQKPNQESKNQKPYEPKKTQSIKQQIKRQLQKDSNSKKQKGKVQIVSVGSSQQCQSGQYIEVQFYNANKNQFSKKKS